MFEDAKPYTGNMAKGFGIGLILDMAGFLASLVVGFLLVFLGGLFILAAFGLLQLAWLVPFYLMFKRQGETETAKGILVTAGIVFLLNAACDGVLFTSRIGG
jgi:hypothetical protein